MFVLFYFKGVKMTERWDPSHQIELGNTKHGIVNNALFTFLTHDKTTLIQIKLTSIYKSHYNFKNICSSKMCL